MPPHISRSTSATRWSARTKTGCSSSAFCSAATRSSRSSGDAATFLETALAEGRRYEERVAQDLSSVVFERAFPSLVGALADASGASLADIRQAALIFLYRLLFVLYAEDRGLLPVNDSRYDDYGLRKRVRDDVARRTQAGDTFSSVASNYYDHFTTLCRLIDEGDQSIGLPPYNGGLFAGELRPDAGARPAG